MIVIPNQSNWNFIVPVNHWKCSPTTLCGDSVVPQHPVHLQQNVPKWMWTLTSDHTAVTLASLCHYWNVDFWKWSYGSIREAARCVPCARHLRPPGAQFSALLFARILPMSLRFCCCMWVSVIASWGAGGRRTVADRWGGLVNPPSCCFHLLFLFAQFCLLQLRKRLLCYLLPVWL